MPKIHCLNNISSAGTDLLPESYQLTDELAEATGVLVRSAAMHDMEFGSDLLAIARAGAGVNNIPLDRCASEGIVVFNTPGANANAVKELVIAGMLLACRDIVGGIEWCRQNADDADIAKSAEKAKKAFAGIEILGKTLGVVGLGAIGEKVADAAVALGMKVIGYDPYANPSKLAAIAQVTDSLDYLYEQSDFITIHVPAMDSTKGMINADACAKMKDGAVVLNFSRDTLVDGPAMAQALESGKLRSYVTDFATPEVMQMKGAIVIPHLGASTAEAEDNCAIMATNQIVDYIDNGNIVNSVNFPAVQMGSVPQEGTRVGVLHANVPNMLAGITGVFGEQGENIAGTANGSKGDWAYTLIDVEDEVTEGVLEELRALDGVVRVRAIG